MFTDCRVPPVSLGRRVTAVQHGTGGHTLVPQHAVHAVRVLAHVHGQQLCAVHGEERVRELRPRDPRQISAQGETRNSQQRLEITVIYSMQRERYSQGLG